MIFKVNHKIVFSFKNKNVRETLMLIVKSRSNLHFPCEKIKNILIIESKVNVN